MATINIRDIPDEIVAAIDAAASAANTRSRESYLRDFLKRSFGVDESVVSAVAARLRLVVSHFETLGYMGVLQPEPTVPEIARALGHSDPSNLESALRGDQALSFLDGDKLCGLLSLDRGWLESGGQTAPRFAQRALHHDCHVLLRQFLANGIPYEHLYFVLSDSESGDAAIIGHTPSDDPEVGWRYDLLVDNIPIHNHVGGTGRAQRRNFADLMVALYDDELFPEPSWCIGRIVPPVAYGGAVSGFVHTATVTNTNSRGSAKAVALQSHWHEDFWSFERGDAYTKNYGAGRVALQADLRSKKIVSDDSYRAYVRKMIRSWKLAAGRN